MPQRTIAYTREQLLVRAQETAERMVGTLEAERLVPRFVDAYVARYDRGGLKVSPLRYRELLTTITRESLVAMAAHVSRELPRHLGAGSRGLLGSAQAEAADVFKEEFFIRLARAKKWGPGELEEFHRDVTLYAQMSLRKSELAKRDRGISSRRPEPQRSRPREVKKGDLLEGPFVDRCALLLDPSLMDKARQSAGAYQAELENAAERVLDNVFRLNWKG